MRRRPVRRRRATVDGADVQVSQAQSVAALDGDRLVREAGCMERGEQEVARRIAGEDAASPVAAVGSRCEANDEHARPWVAKSGQWPRPVRLAGEAPRRVAGGFLPPPDKAWAAAAVNDTCVDRLELLARHLTAGRLGG
ncbi:MAG TPA: hypothetical protein VNW68_04920 [Candidatus Limnocylindria bacterium]|nr:hypothetical protein [Candidatus Limnocylindria bacterium]